MIEIFIAYEIDHYRGPYPATKRLSIVAHITPEKADLTFLSKVGRVYETLRTFVCFTPLSPGSCRITPGPAEVRTRVPGANAL
jgi:hypothetical protein